MERKNLGAEVFRLTRPQPKITDKGLRRPVDFNSYPGTFSKLLAGHGSSVSRRLSHGKPSYFS
jgi:hypothetical protein